jgi:hypothetical protein
MSTLERLSDARGTLEGKIVAVVLAVLLVMPIVGVTAFAESEDGHSTAATEEAVDTPVVDELPDTGNQPITDTAEPEQPAASAPVTEPEADEPEADVTDEPEVVSEVELGLDVAAGASVKYKGECYDENFSSVMVASDADAKFSVELDEGYALANEKAAVLKAATGAEAELKAVDGIYTIEADQLVEGLTLVVSTQVVAASETDGNAPVEEDTWEYPASAQSISAKAWCTTLSLGDAAFSTESLSELGSETGMSIAELATPSIEKNGNFYFFHHAQLPLKGDQQTDKDDDKDKYDPAAAVNALRYNQSVGSWQYNAGAGWVSFDTSSYQLVLYYNQRLNIGGDDSDVSINAKDWPYTEDEWMSGKGSNTAAVVIYQLYNASGELLGKQFRTYYYSANFDKTGINLEVPEFWQLDSLCVKPLHNAPMPERDKAYEAVQSASTYDALTQYPGGYSTSNPMNFTIPFESNGNCRIWMVGVKASALPSESNLTVQYLDEKTEEPIAGEVSVDAKKPDGTPAPAWDDYVALRQDNGNVKAYPKSGGNSDSMVISTTMGDTTVNLTVAKTGYAPAQVRADLDGNILKLYFERNYGVTYKWTGLVEEDVDEFVDGSGHKVSDLPSCTERYVESAEYNVDPSHDEGMLIYAVADGKVTAVYQFSGWKLNGEGEAITGKKTMGAADVVLEGKWDCLTERYTGSVKVDGQVYDGTAGYTDTLKPVFTDPTDSTANPEPTKYIYKDAEGKELKGAPTDAGTYTVTAVWEATDKRPQVESNPCSFTIAKRPVTLISESASKPYDGTELRMPNVTVKDDSGVFNNEATAVAEGVVLNAGDEVENTISVTGKTEKYNEDNYLITYISGTLKVTDAVKIATEDVIKEYDGQGASIQASTDEGWTLWYSTDEGENKTWSAENPVSGEDVGTYIVFVKATRDGYAEVKPVSAKVTITPAPVTITVDDASKIAGTDDPAFTGSIEGEVEGHPLQGVTYYRSNDAESVGVYANVLDASFDASLGDNPNYAVTVEPGTFTITAMALPDNPPTPGPIDTIIDFLSTPIIGGTPGTDGPTVNIADDGTPLANTPFASIDDDANPLSAFDHPLCWVHYYILLGMIITAIYGGGVIARRLNYNRKIKGYEDDVTGKSRTTEEVKRPAAAPSKA